MNRRVSTYQILAPLSSARARWRSSRLRAALARAALDRVYQGSSFRSVPIQVAHSGGYAASVLTRIWQLLAAHGWLIALVLLIALGEASGHWSSLLAATPPEYDSRSSNLQIVEVPPASSVQMLASLYASGSMHQITIPPAVAAPIAPAPSAPLQIADAFRTVHLLGAGETLGGLAEQYGVSLASIIWSNGLERGDALMLGQPLRIPRVSGVPYVVGAGEGVDVIAARFGVPPEAILSFAPNRINDGGSLTEGSEIFVPGGDVSQAEALLSQGGTEAQAARGPEPAGVVLEDETNLRDGPGTGYARQVQLERGRQVALRARHGEWLKVDIAGSIGWVRADLLQIVDGLVDALPETDDFPPLPPRWVWPTWGTLTSSFGSRWGGFHNGLDIANRAWTPIVAARAGWVSEAGWCSGYGYCVKIHHGGGVTTIYGHLITKPSVAVGDEVSAGQRIGSMGSTYDRAGGGYSTGVHLHFTVLVNDRAVNPLTVLP
jgi:murein DD-endopeptidase MepM/ murein hydrolase activator NlpD